MKAIFSLTILFFSSTNLFAQVQVWQLYNSGTNLKILSFTQDNTTNIWFGTGFGYKLCKLNINAGIIETWSIPSNYPIYSLDCDQNGNILIGTQDTVLVKFDGSQLSYVSMRPIINVTPNHNNANCVRVDNV